MRGPIGPERSVSYVPGGVLIALGVLGAIVWMGLGFLELHDTVEGFERVPYPDGGTVVIDEPGGQVIYAEGGEEVVVGARLVVLGPDGAEIATEVYGSSISYSIAGHSGRAVVTFDAPAAGQYRVGPAGLVVSSTATELAVGPSIGGDMATMGVGAVLIAVVGVGLGAVLVWRAKRRRQAPTNPSIVS
ncbi:MAG: hypothetical protein AAFZ07_25945 [Actinomycetota bacterium]